SRTAGSTPTVGRWPNPTGWWPAPGWTSSCPSPSVRSPPNPRRRRWWTVSRCCTPTTTSSWWTSRSGSRPTRARDGPARRWAVVAGGRPSVTHYETHEAFPAASLLEVTLETGRTHQIRVHMSAVRHPCVGDLAYGADPTLAARLNLGRQWLHAHQLGFAHP